MHSSRGLANVLRPGQRLRSIYLQLQQSQSDQKTRAAIIYYRTPTIDARLQLADELVRTVLPKRGKNDGGHDHQDVKIWNELRKEINSLLPIRNRIAHHPVTGATYPEFSAVADLFDQRTWYQSQVSESEKLRGRHEDAKPIGGVELSMHRGEVETIITKLELFISNVISKYV
jgi:hypothetical protein